MLFRTQEVRCNYGNIVDCKRHASKLVQRLQRLSSTSLAILLMARNELNTEK